MKIDLHKLADQAIRFGGPIVLAALMHKLATGKLDVKGAVLSAISESPALSADAIGATVTAAMGKVLA